MSDFKLNSNATSRSTTFSSDPFECLENFETPKESSKAESFPNTRSIKPSIHPKPKSESSSFYISTSLAKAPLDDFKTSAGTSKNYKKPATNSMPTIIKIKPIVSNKNKASIETHSNVCNVSQIPEELSDMFSLPMPTIPPPQLPSLDSPEDEGYAVALYNYESDMIEDLNFKVSTQTNVKGIKLTTQFFFRLMKKFI